MKQVNLASREPGPEKAAAAGIFEVAREQKRYTLGIESFEILEAYGIPW